MSSSCVVQFAPLETSSLFVLESFHKSSFLQWRKKLKEGLLQNEYNVILVWRLNRTIYLSVFNNILVNEYFATTNNNWNTVQPVFKHHPLEENDLVTGGVGLHGHLCRKWVIGTLKVRLLKTGHCYTKMVLSTRSTVNDLGFICYFHIFSTKYKSIFSPNKVNKLVVHL